MTLEDTTEAVLEAQQTTQPETLLGQHTVSLGTCVFQQKDCVLGRFDYIWIWIQ